VPFFSDPDDSIIRITAPDDKWSEAIAVLAGCHAGVTLENATEIGAVLITHR
jgi:hypothetical protein